jgi:hypothetical protein
MVLIPDVLEIVRRIAGSVAAIDGQHLPLHLYSEEQNRKLRLTKSYNVNQPPNSGESSPGSTRNAGLMEILRGGSHL